MEPFPWTCPFCGRDTTILESNYDLSSTTLFKSNVYGRKKVYTEFIVCPNTECREFTLTIKLYDFNKVPKPGLLPGYDLAEAEFPAQVWRLIPPSEAKVFASKYKISKAVLADYKEACLIRDLSPKASSTLSRRCLQGMIRDFWGVVKPKLKLEIEAIKDKVDPNTWGAIDAVRTVGNIGAHMEEDINLIIDVEPHEAQLLIGLIETLIKDWYIAKYERETRLQEIKKMAEGKAAKKKGSGKDKPAP